MTERPGGIPSYFFDVGGVLLTNGWDTGARKRAAETFGLDYPDFQTRHEMLKTAFETAFPAPKGAKDATAVPPPPPAEMEQRLLGNQKVDPVDLAMLADARAKGVLAWLLNTAKADPERVFQVRTGQAKGAVVAFALK